MKTLLLHQVETTFNLTIDLCAVKKIVVLGERDLLLKKKSLK
jgi:hypothetical protein